MSDHSTNEDMDKNEKVFNTTLKHLINTSVKSAVNKSLEAIVLELGKT